MTNAYGVAFSNIDNACNTSTHSSHLQRGLTKHYGNKFTGYVDIISGCRRKFSKSGVTHALCSEYLEMQVIYSMHYDSLSLY